MERRESRMRELVGEDMRKVLEDWEKRMEGVREMRGQGGQSQEREKELGTDKVRKKRGDC